MQGRAELKSLVQRPTNPAGIHQSLDAWLPSKKPSGCPQVGDTACFGQHNPWRCMFRTAGGGPAARLCRLSTQVSSRWQLAANLAAQLVNPPECGALNFHPSPITCTAAPLWATGGCQRHCPRLGLRPKQLPRIKFSWKNHDSASLDHLVHAMLACIVIALQHAPGRGCGGWHTANVAAFMSCA